MPIRPVDKSVFFEFECDIDQEVLTLGAVRYVISDVVAEQMFSLGYFSYEGNA